MIQNVTSVTYIIIIIARFSRYGRYSRCGWRSRAELSASTIGEASDRRGGGIPTVFTGWGNDTFQASLWGLGTAHCPHPPSPNPPAHTIMWIAKGCGLDMQSYVKRIAGRDAIHSGTRNADLESNHFKKIFDDAWLSITFVWCSIDHLLLSFCVTQRGTKRRSQPFRKSCCILKKIGLRTC